jgi:hypothetical protein
MFVSRMPLIFRRDISHLSLEWRVFLWKASRKPLQNSSARVNFLSEQTPTFNYQIDPIVSPTPPSRCVGLRLNRFLTNPSAHCWDTTVGKLYCGTSFRMWACFPPSSNSSFLSEQTPTSNCPLHLIPSPTPPHGCLAFRLNTISTIATVPLELALHDHGTGNSGNLENHSKTAQQELTFCQSKPQLSTIRSIPLFLLRLRLDA